MKTVDSSETIEACDLKVGRYRQIIDSYEGMCYEGQGHTKIQSKVFSLTTVPF